MEKVLWEHKHHHPFLSRERKPKRVKDEEWLSREIGIHEKPSVRETVDEPSQKDLRQDARQEASEHDEKAALGVGTSR